ncbi:unnamed protein product [Rotaria socialis]|uniref:Uncharacterized protein n=2 Tax=Rotaria socialis TaxID=392032 RepID=A0A817ZIA4_9BILA|nr:unnamed protein product [Rotaria socialis]CAF3421024.1 unnamed protein product [Rotaria socialis]CAF3492170.1 unnamed protein product [Rotaria socialis]CAF4225062.1 unnamed protein product [Rotaria socialis]CAF4475338.1 unnamed protein product [Rotaria socialis]
MAYHNHDLKRLQPTTHSSEYNLSIDDNEAMKEFVQQFSITYNNINKHFPPFKPGPHRARRGGGNGRAYDRNFFSSVSLPKRAIHYDLAESFMDHSTNPLSSNLYKVRFQHSAKQWPNGRFVNYKEILDKSDGYIIGLTCALNFPLVPKRKRVEETQQDSLSAQSSLSFADPISEEQKKKLADKQTNLYANLFGCGKIPRLPSNTQIKKSNSINNVTKSSDLIALLNENKEDNPCS